jgi:hypothetical protein
MIRPEFMWYLFWPPIPDPLPEPGGCKSKAEEKRRTAPRHWRDGGCPFEPRPRFGDDMSSWRASEKTLHPPTI